jgi:hypothetical protein
VRIGWLWDLAKLVVEVAKIEQRFLAVSPKTKQLCCNRPITLSCGLITILRIAVSYALQHRLDLTMPKAIGEGAYVGYSQTSFGKANLGT